MFCLPSASIFLPCTTLFRSVLRRAVDVQRVGREVVARRIRPRAAPVGERELLPRGAEEAVADDLVAVRRLDAPPRRREDRKSTRLNSSHLVISYDVFCLKNK